MTSTARTVLISGCASGSGAALAQEFHARVHKAITEGRANMSQRGATLSDVLPGKR
jgi:short-subunit dehydrogenase involved in D-alanine esterification of teichoic acids